MNDSRTEKPTPRRIRRARQEGEGFSRSPEVAVAFSLIGMAVSLRLLAPGAIEGLVADARRLFAAGAAPDPLAVASERVGTMFTAALAPFLVVAVVAALVAGVAQTGIVFTPAAAKPKLKNLSLRRGLERLKPGRALWELARSTVKVTLLTAIAWSVLETWITFLRSRHGLGEALAMTAAQSWSLIWRAALVATVVAVADYSINRYRTKKSLRMTRSEVKQDQKETDGDPMVRMRRRRLASEVSRNRMIGEVGMADVVVANPTHIAVALRYQGDEPAPRVVARGAGVLAERIKAEARRHGVLVTENRPLARTLFRSCRPGQLIPSSLYEAVAVVLAAAYRRRGRSA